MLHGITDWLDARTAIHILRFLLDAYKLFRPIAPKAPAGKPRRSKKAVKMGNRRRRRR